MAATMGPTAPEGGLNRRARKALAAKAHREENQRVTATLFVRNLSFEYVSRRCPFSLLLLVHMRLPSLSLLSPLLFYSVIPLS